MTPNVILEGIGTALKNPLNLLFLALQIGVFWRALVLMQKRTRAAQEFVRVAPERLTGLGILGTFSGIFLGLIQFKVADISASLPPLLQGMTTAFIASVVGLSLALLLRTLHDQHRKRYPEMTGGATVLDLQVELLAIREVLVASSEASTAAFGGLQRAIAGDENGTLATYMRQLQEAIGGSGDNTLVTQVRQLRLDQADAARESGRRFDEFAKQVSEMGSKALVEALSDVIRDFNTNLTAQFGDNFKELNSAVHALVLWQEQYRQQVEKLGKQFDASLEGVAASESSLKAIAASSSSIPESMAKLTTVLTGLQAQQTILDTQLHAYAELGQQAISAMPVIDRNIATLVTGMAETVGRSIERMGKAEKEQSNALEKMGGAYEALRAGIQKSVTSHDEQFQQLIMRFSVTHAALESQLREMQQKANAAWRDAFDKSVEEQNGLMSQQVANLDAALGAEMQKAITNLSQHLLGLHERLVKDYTPLTDRLRQLVDIAARDGSR